MYWKGLKHIVPKHEIQHLAGHPITQELKEILRRYFNEKDIAKIERLGGRVLISLTAPFDQRKKGGGPKIEIGEKLIDQLRKLRDKPDGLKEQLAPLSIKQLRKLGNLVNHPLRTKSPRQELIEELVAYFHGEEVWRRISGGS